HYLTQDMLEVQVGKDVFIDVGWWPQRDPSGSYVVSVFRKTWERQLKPQYFTKDWVDAAAKVEEWSRYFSTRRLYNISVGNGHGGGHPQLPLRPAFLGVIPLWARWLWIREPAAGWRVAGWRVAGTQPGKELLSSGGHQASRQTSIALPHRPRTLCRP